VLVSPRSSGTNTPLKIYQYLRAGRPIVATRLLTHTQVLSDQTAILTPATAVDFAAGSAVMAGTIPVMTGRAQRCARHARSKASAFLSSDFSGTPVVRPGTSTTIVSPLFKSENSRGLTLVRPPRSTARGFFSLGSAVAATSTRAYPFDSRTRAGSGYLDIYAAVKGTHGPRRGRHFRPRNGDE